MRIVSSDESVDFNPIEYLKYSDKYFGEVTKYLRGEGDVRHRGHHHHRE